MARGYWKPLDEPTDDPLPDYPVGCFKVVLCIVLLLASCFAAGYLLGHFGGHHG